MKLNIKQIKALKPCESGKPKRHPDGRGMYLLVNPNGSKWWRLDYRINGTRKTLSLGVYPDVGLADARRKTTEAKEQIAQGIDPSDIRKEAKAEASGHNHFINVAKRWHDDMIKDNEWTESHAVKIWRSLESHVFPHIGTTDIGEIKAPTIKPMFDKLADDGKTEMLKKVRQRISAIFNHAITEGIAQGNPTTAIKTRKHERQNYNHITNEELPELVKAIKNHPLEPTTRTGLLIALYTFQRTNEIRFARWDEIDFDNAMWSIPAERMKMKRDHLVPLSRQALNAFKDLQPITGHHDLVFASTHKPDTQPMSENAMLYALYRMGFRKRMTVHGFRHLASTSLNEMGFDSRWIEKQLSHEDSNTIRGTYDKSKHIIERIDMLQQWADFADRADGSNIVPIGHKKNEV